MSDLFTSSPPPARRGMGGHQSAASDTEVWLTPPPILASLGAFDLDPCAVVAPRPWATANEHLTVRENGLAQRWRGSVFMNPPYGGPTVIGPWMRRIAEHGSGTALIFARTETEMFHECVWDSAHAVLFLRGRLFFHRPDGTRADHNAGAPSCLVAYGPDDVARLEGCGIPGRLLVLR